jgi:hypothetical protein
MADHISKDEFLTHIGYIREDLAEMKTLQKEANGRTTKVEGRVGILEDREPSRTSATVSAGVSAVISGVINGVGLWFSSQK